MERREFITLFVGVAAVWPLAARAQQPAMPVVGFMSGRSPEDSAHVAAAFRQGLADSDFIEGQTVKIRVFPVIVPEPCKWECLRRMRPQCSPIPATF